MGADIYLRSVSDKARATHEPLFHEAVERRNQAGKSGDKAAEEAAQAEVSEHYDAMYPDDGYFRDSYNKTSLFWMMDLSWGQFGGIDENGELPIEEAKKLRAQLADNDIDEAKFNKTFGGRVKTDTASSTEEWREFFADKRNRLIALLDKSIELNEPLYCSV